jgi:hypothetical protein
MCDFRFEGQQGQGGQSNNLLQISLKKIKECCAMLHTYMSMNWAALSIHNTKTCPPI